VDENWPQKGQITFKDVDLRYRPELDLVLHGLSYEVEAGHKVGIVGRSGCGKSTMGLALSRILEVDSGQVLIDGVEVNKVDLETLRSRITVIPQDPVIFDGTLRMNLDPLNKRSDEEIEKVLRQAGLEDLLTKKPETKKKFDKELDIDEDLGDGTGIHFRLNDADSLSAGEKQLICICRAVLRRNKIVLLDEATANIDIKTEQKI